MPDNMHKLVQKYEYMTHFFGDHKVLSILSDHFVLGQLNFNWELQIFPACCLMRNLFG